MKEFENYIRYAMPGIASLIPLLMAFLISDYDETLLAIQEFDSIGPALAIVLASGGLGFFYSGIYFAIYWGVCGNGLLAVDHRAEIQDFIKNKHLKIHDRSLGKNKKKLTKKRAWEISAIIWNAALAGREDIKKINIRVGALNARVHGLGATTVGMLFGSMVWLYFHICHGSQAENTCLQFLKYGGLSSNELISIVIWLIFIGFFAGNFMSAKSIHQSVANKALGYYRYNMGNFTIEFENDFTFLLKDDKS